MILAVGTFALSWWGVFILDDIQIVQHDARIQSPDQWHRIWTRSYWDYDRGETLSGWRPLTTTSYAINWLIAGDSPWSYHVINTLLHGAVTLLVFTVALDLIGALWPAAFAAALFAVHPVHTEAVANVIGRSELMAALFALLAWLAHRRCQPKRAAMWLMLGVLSKESAITILGVMALDDVLNRARSPLTLRLRVKAWAPPLLGVAVYLLARWAVLGNAGGGERIRHLVPLNPLLRGDLSLTVEWATAVKMLGLQWWLFLWPARLAADYSWHQVPLSESFLDPPVAASLLGFAALILVTASVRRRQPEVPLALGMWFLTALLTSNLILTVGVLFAERFVYLPSVGMCLLAGSALVGVSRLRGEWVRLVVPAACLLILIAGTARSVRRTWDWNDRVRLWEHEVRISPLGSQAWSALGVAYDETGQPEQARRALWRAIELSRMPGALGNRPTHLPALRRLPQVLIGLAASAAQAGDVERLRELEAETDRAIALCLRADPGHAAVLSIHALRLLSRGDPEGAERVMGRALGIDDTNPVVLSNRAEHLLRTNRAEEALELLDRAIALYPEAPIFHRMAAMIHAALGNAEQAESHLQVFLRLSGQSD